VDEINIKTIRVKNRKDKLIGLGTKDAPKAVNIVSLQSEDPNDQQFYPGMSAPPGITPFGLVDFKVLVATPGDQAELTIYFSEDVPEGSIWYKYDSVQNIWIDFSDYAVISPNRMSLTLYLQDGGEGDADGLANGIIVDPSGLVSPASLDTSLPADSYSNSSGSSSCFINSSREISDNEMESKAGWIILIGCLVSIFMGITCYIQQFKKNRSGVK